MNDSWRNQIVGFPARPRKGIGKWTPKGKGKGKYFFGFFGKGAGKGPFVSDLSMAKGSKGKGGSHHSLEPFRRTLKMSKTSTALMHGGMSGLIRKAQTLALLMNPGKT